MSFIAESPAASIRRMNGSICSTNRYDLWLIPISRITSPTVSRICLTASRQKRS